MTWWQLLALMFLIVFFTIVLLIWFGFALYIRSTRVNPAIEAITIKEDLVFHRELLDNVGMFNTEWKLANYNRYTVKYKVKQGIFKSVDKEWPSDDYWELTGTNDKKIVIFGLHNLEAKWARQMSIMQRSLNSALARAVIAEENYKNLLVNFDNKILERQEQIKNQLPVIINPKNAGAGGKK